MVTVKNQRRRQRLGPIIGTPGGSLGNASWASSEGAAAAGRRGEQRTGEVLTKFVAPYGPAVLHDLVMPLPNVRANIDHVFVSGRHVWILDSKLWRPDTYRTSRGKTKRGNEDFVDANGKNIADHKTYIMAKKSLAQYLDNCGVTAAVHTPWVIIWPSNDDNKLRVRRYHPQGAVAMTGRFFEKFARWRLGQAGANRDIVKVLSGLVR